MAANTEARNVLVLLHGRGMTSTDFSDDISDLADLLSKHNFRLVLPGSKLRYSSVFQCEMSEWFDIYSLGDPDSRQELQLPGIQESVQEILQVIKEEVKTVDGDYGRVFLGGISQGMAVASLVLLLLGGKLGGFVGASGWVPFQQELSDAIDASLDMRRVLQEKLGLVRDDNIEDHNKEKPTPVFLGHGVDDIWVDIELGRKAGDLLRRCGYKVTLKEYAGAEQEGHWFKEPEQYDDMVAFLDQRS